MMTWCSVGAARTSRAAVACLTVVGFLLTAVTAGAAEETDKQALRVCADPSNLPYSNKAGEGFENRIAELFAKQLGLPLEYYWYPMQMGFARNTLAEYEPEAGRHRCDLIIGTTSGLEVGKTTEPYYYSTYALVYRRGDGLGDIKTLDDILALPEQRRQSLKIGVFARSPATQWLLRNGLVGQMVSYQHQSGSAEVTPGTVIRRDLANGELDMIFVWGPIGGYYVKRLRQCEDCEHTDMSVVPLQSGDGQRYHFGISMGVRYGNDEWLATVQGLIERNSDEIDDILRDYNVPLVDENGALIETSSDS